VVEVRAQRASKPLSTLATLVLGVVVGLSSAALHQHWWGLALAIAASGTTAYALPPGWWSRLPFAVGWVAMVGYLAVPRDEGDYVVAGDLPGYLLLGCAVALLMAAAVTLPSRKAG
jgi:hypothetical protein